MPVRPLHLVRAIAPTRCPLERLLELEDVDVRLEPEDSGLEPEGSGQHAMEAPHH